MSLSSNAVLTKARSMYAHHLDMSQYEELMKKERVRDIFMYLKSCDGYSDTFASKREIRRRGELEAFIDEEMMVKISRLIHYISVKELPFYKMAVMRLEIIILTRQLTCLNAQRTFQLVSQVPRNIRKLMSFKLDQIDTVTSVDELISFLKKTPYAAIISQNRRENGTVNLNAVELAFKRLYYQTYIDVVTRQFRGQTRDDLLLMLKTEMELENICRIYRLKKFFNIPPEDIKKSLYLDYSRIPRKALDAMIESKDAESFLQLLASSPYHLYLDDQEFVFIEYYTERIQYHLAKRYMRYSTDPAVVFMTFVILHSIENTNLKHIIEGVRYHESQDKIEQLLIY